MKNIVVFGKPKAFESYEFEFEERLTTKKENTHIEPYIRPIDLKKAVLHYYVKENYVCYEYYARANGFTSDRIGGVFGVCIKSDKDIKLFDAQESVLLPFYKDLSDSFLYNNNSFNTQSIINQVSKTEWSPEEQEAIDNVVDNVPFIKATKELLLLVVPDFRKVENIESQIKEYSDVYIADNPDIFKNSDHKLYLKKCNYLIFTVEDDNLVPYKKAKKDENGSDGTGFRKPPGGNDNDEGGEDRKGFEKGPYRGNGNSGGGESPLPPGTDTDTKPDTWWTRTLIMVLSIFGTLVVLVVIVLILNSLFSSSSGGTSVNVPVGDSGTGSGTVEQPTEQKNFSANAVKLANYDDPIKESLYLNPIPMYDGDENKTTTVPNEISLDLSEEGKKYAKIENNNLNVTNKPNQDTKVTVIAKLKQSGEELARKEYTIAKKVEVNTGSSSTEGEKGSQIKQTDIVIIFEGGYNKNSVFFVGDKISATAKIYNKKAEGGKWEITQGLTTNDLNANPITIEITEYNENAKIAYKIGNVFNNVQINISK